MANPNVLDMQFMAKQSALMSAVMNDAGTTAARDSLSKQVADWKWPGMGADYDISSTWTSPGQPDFMVTWLNGSVSQYIHDNYNTLAWVVCQGTELTPLKTKRDFAHLCFMHIVARPIWD